MTATGQTTSAASRVNDNFAGTAALVRFLLRRDRVRLPAWAAGFGLFIAYLAAALPTIAQTEAELVAATQLFQDPIGRMFVGPGYGFDAPSFERFVANGYGLYLLILAALMSILLVSRHTRVAEQSGRAELILANVVGRHGPLTAAMIVAAITNGVVAAVVVAAMIGIGGWSAYGSIVLAASIAVIGLFFAAVTAITAQLSEYSRASTGAASAVLGVAFLLRAGGDMAAAGGTWLSWLSPLAWGQQSAPFVLNRWWPLLLAGGCALLATGAAFVLSTRRDLGASLVAARAGRRHAAPYLGTAWGLASRLQRGLVIGWAVGLALTGLAYGAYADALLTAIGDLPEVFVELFGAENLLAGYLAYIAEFTAYLAAATSVLAVQGWRSEEFSGRAEPVLATPVSRDRWFVANFSVAAVSSVALMAIAGLAAGVGTAAVTGRWSYVGELLIAHINLVPAVWTVLAVGALLFGWAPRAIGTAWFFVGFGLFAGTFGGLLQIPDSVLNLSPFIHVAAHPVEAIAPAPLGLLTAVAVVLAGVGLVGYRRRDITTT